MSDLLDDELSKPCNETGVRIIMISGCIELLVTFR